MAQNTSEVRKEIIEALCDAINEKSEAKVQALLEAKARLAEINHRLFGQSSALAPESAATHSQAQETNKSSCSIQ